MISKLSVLSGKPKKALSGVFGGRSISELVIVNSQTTWRKIYTFPFDFFLWKM